MTKSKIILILIMLISVIYCVNATKQEIYPEPFVVDDELISNFAIIVGEKADAKDTIGAIEIMNDLTAKTNKEEKKQEKIEVDAIQIEAPTNKLNLNETLGNVRQSLTEFDLDMLKGGSITTRRGVTKYNQYLKFNDSKTRTSGKIIFTEDEFDNVGHYLFWNETQDKEIFRYEIEFEEGLMTDVQNKSLRDLEDRELNILGQTYTIIESEFKGNTTVGDEIKIESMSGPIEGDLGEGDKETYVLNGKEYEIEIIIISETEGKALIKVNGQTLPRMKAGELEPTSDGTLLGLRDVHKTGKDTQSSIVEFFLGASKIEFKDSDWSDNVYTTSGAVINNEVIEDADVKITAKALENDASEPTKATKASIIGISYRLNADSLVGNLYVPPGHGVREYLDEPEGLIAPYWDIKYHGFKDNPISVIRFNPISKDEYKLEFVNQEGLQYVVPYLSNRLGTLRLGDDRRRLVFREGDNELDFNIKIDDYFIVSDIEVDGNALDLRNQTMLTSQTDNTAFTHVLKYESADTTQRVLTFTDLATGTKQVPYDNEGIFNLFVTGVNYIGRINTSNDNNLSIDIDSDGNRTNGTAVIATENGALIVLGAHKQADDLDRANITITTTAGQLKIRAERNEVTKLTFLQRSNNRIGLNATEATGIDFHYLTSEPEIAQGLTMAHGTFFELFDPLTTDTPEELTIEYPIKKRVVKVTVGDHRKKEAEKEKISEKNMQTSKLDTEVKDIKEYNAIIVGGPCANKIAAKLMNNPNPCWEAIPYGKHVVKIFEHENGNTASLIAGRTAEETRKAVREVLSGK